MANGVNLDPQVAAVLDYQQTVDGTTIPTPDELFDLAEQGELGQPVEGVELAVESPLVASEVTGWIHSRIQAVRAAGSRGSWSERRDVHSRTFAERDRKPGSIGRYLGKSAVNLRDLAVEWGTSDVNRVVAVATSET